jgi:hypothetical protein
MVSDEKKETARNSFISSGKMEWVLERGRDHWSCRCEELAKGGPYDAYNPRDKDGNPVDIPLHPNCVKGGTKILTAHGYKKIERLKPGDYVISHDGTANQITAMCKTKYSGDIIRLNNGPWTTPDHRYLSGDAWNTAQSLNNGDYITAVSGDQRSSRFIGNFIPNDCPSKRPEEGSFIIVLDYFTLAAGMPLTAVYFNGKFYIGKCQIDIIFSYCESGEWDIPAIEKFIKEHSFVSAADFPGFRGGTFFKIRFGPFHSPYRSMCRIGIGDKASRIISSCGFLHRRGRNTNSKKPAVNTPAGNSKDFGYGKNRQAVFFKKDAQPFKVNISFDNHKKIITKRHAQYNGYIYDITVSATNSYISNGMIMHNCGCMWRPILLSDDEVMKRYKEEIRKEWEAAGML